MSLSVRLLAFASLWEARHDSLAIFDERPVSGIDAILAAFWSGDFDNLDAGLLEAVNNSSVFSLGLLDVDSLFVVIWVNFVIVSEKFCSGYE